MFTTIAFSDHAVKRMVCRDFSEEDLEYVMWFGRKIYSGGVLHVFLGSRDIPESDKRNPRLARLEGTTILLDSRGARAIITVYRNRKAIREIRRKDKYNHHKASRLQDGGEFLMDPVESLLEALPG